MTADFGTESVRVALFDPLGRVIAMSEHPYATYHPHAGWAEQKPAEWRSAFINAARKVVTESGVEPVRIASLTVDTTCSTLCFLDSSFNPLCDSILWMDVRSSDQARRISATNDDALKYNGHGNVPADWMPSKMLWMKENRPEIYRASVHVCEFQDWMNYLLTGRYVGCLNNFTVRWYFDDGKGGWPERFYHRIGIAEILDKVPAEVFGVGEIIGEIEPGIAAEIGLPPCTVVVQGGSDAYVGTLGLGVVHEGDVGLITGSSHLLLGATTREVHDPSISGAFPDAVLPGLSLLEGSQTSTGSVLKWYTGNFINSDIVQGAANARLGLYEYLDSEARDIALGSEGLIVLDHWQGNRNPFSDPLSRGVLWGLSLKHTPFHVYRAIMEGVAYGTRLILDAFRHCGLRCERLIAGGGITRSSVWMQIHSDVLGLPIVVNTVTDVPLLGCAVVSARAMGLYPSIESAVAAMVHCADMVVPDTAKTAAYVSFVERYRATYERMADLMNDMTSRHSARE